MVQIGSQFGFQGVGSNTPSLPTPAKEEKERQSLVTQPGFQGISTISGAKILGEDLYREKMEEADKNGVSRESVTKAIVDKGYTIEGMDDYYQAQNHKRVQQMAASNKMGLDPEEFESIFNESNQWEGTPQEKLSRFQGLIADRQRILEDRTEGEKLLEGLGKGYGETFKQQRGAIGDFFGGAVSHVPKILANFGSFGAKLLGDGVNVNPLSAFRWEGSEEAALDITKPVQFAPLSPLANVWDLADLWGRALWQGIGKILGIETKEDALKLNLGGTAEQAARDAEDVSKFANEIKAYGQDVLGVDPESTATALGELAGEIWAAIALTPGGAGQSIATAANKAIADAGLKASPRLLRLLGPMVEGAYEAQIFAVANRGEQATIEESLLGMAGGAGAEVLAAGTAAVPKIAKVFKRWVSAADEAALAATKVEDISQAAARVTQSKKATEIASAGRALRDVDLTEVDTFQWLDESLGSRKTSIARQQDELLAQDTRLFKPEQTQRTVGEGVDAIATNPVDDSLTKLETLFDETGATDELFEIRQLRRKFNEEGLSATEINQLARDFNSKGNFSFSDATGAPKSSVNAQAAENTRTALKDFVGKEVVTGEEVRALDKAFSDVATTQRGIGKLSEQVQGISNKLDDPKFTTRLRNAGIELANFNPGSAMKNLVGVQTKKSLNALDLQSQLSKNIDEFNKLVQKAERARTETGLRKAAEEIQKFMDKFDISAAPAAIGAGEVLRSEDQ